MLFIVRKRWDFKKKAKMKEDMKDARNMPDAAFGSQANPEAVAPQSGQWTSTYVEERKTK